MLIGSLIDLREIGAAIDASWKCYANPYTWGF